MLMVTLSVMLKQESFIFIINLQLYGFCCATLRNPDSQEVNSNLSFLLKAYPSLKEQTPLCPPRSKVNYMTMSVKPVLSLMALKKVMIKSKVKAIIA